MNDDALPEPVRKLMADWPTLDQVSIESCWFRRSWDVELDIAGPHPFMANATLHINEVTEANSFADAIEQVCAKVRARIEESRG